MAQYFLIHPTHPQRKLIAQAVHIVRGGGLIVYPTDSCYALGCHIGNKHAMERIRAIRRLNDSHHFTLVCRDLSEISRYAIGRQSRVPVAQGHHTGQLHILVAGYARGAAAAAESAPQDHRSSHSRPPGSAGTARRARRAAVILYSAAAR